MEYLVLSFIFRYNVINTVFWLFISFTVFNTREKCNIFPHLYYQV